MATLRIALALAVLATGCAQAELKSAPPQPDGGVDCPASPVISCDSGAPAEGCAGEPSILPASVVAPVYPIGCRAYFTSPDCSTNTSCSCLRDDAGTARWVCGPV